VNEDDISGAYSVNGDMTNAYILLVGKPEGKRPQRTSISMGITNIKMDLAEPVWGNVDWTGADQDRDKWRALVNSVMNLQVVRFEVSTAVTIKNVVFWDASSCGSCKNRRFGGMHRLHQIFFFAACFGC
jgi:hypothetical protein